MSAVRFRPAPQVKIKNGGYSHAKSRDEKLKEISRRVGTRHQRKLRKFSDNFNEIFGFFLKSYRSGILSFCGSDVLVKQDSKISGKEGFRMYEDGLFKHKDIVSFHPNVLRGVKSKDYVL